MPRIHCSATRIRSTVLAAGLLLWTLPGMAQHRPYRHYGVEDGLASSTVYCMERDSAGFLWFGTPAGLSRFDGTSFRTFTTDDGLPANEVLELTLDQFGRLWVQCFEAPPCFLEDGVFHTAKNDPSLPDLRSMVNIIHVFPDTDAGDVKLVGKEDVFAYSGQRSERCKGFRPPGGMVYWTGIRHGSIWMYTSSGMFRSRTGTHWEPVALPSVPSPVQVWSGAMCGDELFLSVGEQLVHFKFDDGTLHCVERMPYPFRVQRAYKDHTGALWICAPGDDALRFARGDLTSGPPEHFAPSSSIIKVFMADGLLWLVSDRDGIYKLNGLGDRIYGVRDGLSSDDLHCLLDDGGGAVLVGTDNGQIDRAGAEGVRRMFHRAPRHDMRVLNGAARGRMRFFATDKGTLIIGPGQERIGGEGLSDKDVAIAPNGELLVSAHGGLFRVSAVTGDTLASVHARRSTAVLVDGRGRTLIGGLHGLDVLNGDTSGLGGLVRAMAGIRVSDLLLCRDGSIAVATHGSGVLVWRPSGTLLRAGQVRDGLCSDLCSHVAEDARGRLWVCTNKGLDRLTEEGARWSVRHFSMADGLPDDEVRDVIVHGDSLWVATHRGLALLYQAEDTGSADFPLRILDVRFNGRDTVVANAYEVPYDRNDITISFVALHMRSDGRITYRYKLADEAPWVYTTTGTIKVPRATPGTYTITIQACTSAGTWSHRPAHMTIRVAQPWWQRPWILATILVTALSGSTALLRRRQAQALREEREQERRAKVMVELELQAHRARIDPHFVFNCLNSIQGFVVKEDHERAHRYIARFSGYIRGMLRVARSNFITLQEEMDLLREQTELEMMRAGQRFTTGITAAADVALDTEVPTMLLQTFVENAIKHGLAPLHGRPGELRVHFTRAGDRLICTVTDNGVGIHERPAAERPFSEGLRLARERIALFSAQFEMDIHLQVMPGPEGIGTIVRLEIPLEHPVTDEDDQSIGGRR